MTNQINEFISSSLDAIKNLINVGVVVGNPIIMDNLKIIPISKVKYGFISGGKENISSPVMIGNAGTVSLTPIAIIIASEQDVKMLHLDNNTHLVEYLVDNISDIIQEVLKKIKKES